MGNERILWHRPAVKEGNTNMVNDLLKFKGLVNVKAKNRIKIFWEMFSF